MGVAGALRDTASAGRLVFANPNLRRLNLALAGSMIGDWAYTTAVAVWIYDYGGAAAMGAYAVVRLLLMAVALPFLTVLVDRLPHRAFLISCDLVRAGLVLVAASLIWLDGPPLVVLALAVLVGLVGGPFRPAQMALMPGLAREPRELTAANAVSSTLESLAFFVGPALAGVLLAITDVPVILVLNAASFVWSAALISRIVMPPAAKADPVAPGEPISDPEPSVQFFTEVMAGFRLIRSDRRLLLVTALACAQTLVAGACGIFTVVIAFDVVRLGEPGVGYLNAILGVGALLGGLVALGRSSRDTVALDFGAGVAGWALPALLIAVWPSPVTAFVALALIGLANPLVDVNFATLVQRVVPGALLGRVFGALESALIAAMALGAALFPVLLGLVGLRWALVIISVPVVAAVVAAIPTLRRLDQTIAAPPQLDLVRALPLFQPLAPSLQEELARKLVELRVSAGTAVITEGEVGDRFYLIASGRLDAVRGNALLTEMGAGDCFGEIALLRDVPRTATVVAREDSVLQALERDDFLAAMGAEPEAFSRAGRLVSRRIVH